MALFDSSKNLDARIATEAMEACELIITQMGAEIHDDLIQRLTVLQFSLDRLEQSLVNYPEIDSLIGTVKSEFQEVIHSVRKTSRRLLPVVMEDNSFKQNIAVLCQNLEIPGVGTIHFSSVGVEHEIPALAETYLYRITQELIHNSFKHSSAWNVYVRLSWNQNELQIDVEDDGSGFSKINEFINLLSKKYNTLKMRCTIIRASIRYSIGSKGLLAQVVLPIRS